MEFVGWMYDVAREQAPRLEKTEQWVRSSAAAGYNALGLYLEHRFEYSSAPWAADVGSINPAFVKALTETGASSGVRIIPFLNTLGHMEGFLRTVQGRRLSEGSRFGTEQICPLHPDTPQFVRGLLTDVIDAFSDPWLHLGGDEPWQLGDCPRCRARVSEIGLAGLYGEYYKGLCEFAIAHNRRPALWADMLNAHPEAMTWLPKETLLFDWHYDRAPGPTTGRLRAAGFDVICCPALHTFDAAWCFLDTTVANVQEHVRDARTHGARGVLLTTWEFSYFSEYENVMPLIFALGRFLRSGTSVEDALLEIEGPAYARAAAILGREIPAISQFLAQGTWRALRDRLVIRQNPFELWRDWADEACGEIGTKILELCDSASRHLERTHPLQSAITLHRLAIEFVNRAEFARQSYDAGAWPDCLSHLENAKRVLQGLAPLAAVAEAAGGSIADRHRVGTLLGKVDRTMQRVLRLQEQEQSNRRRYRPAFETIVSDAYVEHDQAAWRTGARDA